MFSTFCLALVVFVEARGEPLDGQLMVAEVVLNRVAIDAYPDTVCGVAFQPKQFSGLNKPVDLATILQDDAWGTSVDIAYDALEGRKPGSLRGNILGTTATHFHNHRVRPYWVDSMDKLGVYGKHTFYIEENAND